MNVKLANRSRQENSGPGRLIRIPFISNDTPELPLNTVSYHLRYCKRTSPGPTELPHWVFNEYWDILARAYHAVWNRSLRAGVFPAHYKKADITPLPKVSRTTDEENVRCISVTPIPSTLFERAVHITFITQNIVDKGE